MRGLEEPPSFGEQLDTLNGAEQRRRRSLSGHKVGSLACVGLVALWGIPKVVRAYEYWNTSGVVEARRAPAPKKIETDNEVNLITWNVANKAFQLRRKIERFADSADAVLLQEVSEGDYRRLKVQLPEHMSIIYGLADKKEHGGYGDAIITQEDYSDERSVSIKGSSVADYGIATATGFTKDVVHQDFSLDDARENPIENREVLMITMKVRQDNKIKEARIMDSHIGAGDIERPYKTIAHLEQYQRLLRIIKDNIQSNGPTFVCADFNEVQKYVIPSLNYLRFTVREPVGPTSLNNPIAIDFCAAQKAGYGHIRLLGEKGSDHKPVEYTWDMDDPSAKFPYLDVNENGQFASIK
jgi:hypothetical protein